MSSVEHLQMRQEILEVIAAITPNFADDITIAKLQELSTAPWSQRILSRIDKNKSWTEATVEELKALEEVYVDFLNSNNKENLDTNQNPEFTNRSQLKILLQFANVVICHSFRTSISGRQPNDRRSFKGRLWVFRVRTH